MTLVRRADIAAIGVMGGPIVLALLLWPSLPQRMAIHWSGSSPDTYVPKTVGTLGIFAFGVASMAFVRVAPDSLTNTPGGENLSVAFLGVVFAIVESIIVAWNLGYRFDVRLAIAPILVLAGAVVLVSYRR